MATASTNRTPFTNLLVAYLASRVRQDREFLVDNLAALHCVMSRQCSHLYVVLTLPNVREKIACLRDIDERRGSRESELHQSDKALPARQDLGVLVLTKQLNCLLQRRGSEIGKFLWRHRGARLQIFRRQYLGFC